MLCPNFFLVLVTMKLRYIMVLLFVVDSGPQKTTLRTTNMGPRRSVLLYLPPVSSFE